MQDRLAGETVQVVDWPDPHSPFVVDQNRSQGGSWYLKKNGPDGANLGDAQGSDADHALVSAHSKSTKCKRPVARKAAEGGTVRDGRPTIQTEGGGATGPPVGVEQVRR